ncbi:unnamed protein product [Amaranthus hypochondriacus]
MKFFLISLAFTLLLLINISEGRKDPGYYWGKKAVEALVDENLSADEKFIVINNFEPRPNQLLVWRGHNKIAST